MKTAAGEITPLWRNRDYNVLWVSQVVSELGAAMSQLAFPLLVIFGSGSVVEIGVVVSARAAARFVAGLPAGALADRYSRKKIMLCCRGTLVVGYTSLVVALLFGAATFPHILATTILAGAASALFGPAEEAALPSIVPRSQLSTTVARNTARTYLAGLIGPAVGGALFGIHRVLPFLVDAVTSALSFVGLLFVRLPHRRVERDTNLGQEMWAGLVWVARQRAIAATLVWVVLSNTVFSAMLVPILAMSGEKDTPPGELGLMMTTLSVGGLIGAAIAPRLHAALPAPVIVIGVSWIAALLTPLLAFCSTALQFGLVLAMVMVFAPTANTTIITYQMMTAPDEFRGRTRGAVRLGTGMAGALGPMLGGVLTAVTGGRNVVLVCVAALLVVAVATTASPTIRGLAGKDR
ncbi:MFS transporter [Amycolatopsis samaneae]|uniref:MFS transporter n=1 Tax=Amycolatopsis samaneae TaxID=664691 RepID=A0ABW5GRI4_9PSEU